MAKWNWVYEKAEYPNGELFFPERLTREFLENAKRAMGSYMYANQYQNEIIPDGEQTFKKEWLKYYKHLPETKYTFAFIDPAISEQKSSDFTALVVVDTDPDGSWYVRNATRFKINPTQMVELIFRVNDQFKPLVIGFEDVSFQRAILHMLDQEMKRRQVTIPVTGIKPDRAKTKEMRILGLVPRFEWGRIFLSQGLNDLELEYSQFPRGSHDDLLDALAYLNAIVTYPAIKKEEYNYHDRPGANHPEYERWYIRNIERIKREREFGPDIE